MSHSRSARRLPASLVLALLAALPAGASPPVFYDGFEVGNTSAWDVRQPAQCPVPPFGPTEHLGTLAASETWLAEDGPHVITGDVTIPVGGNLVIEPCTEVRLRPGTSLLVRGGLQAVGNVGHPIWFRRDNPGQPFAAIRVYGTGLAQLTWVAVAGGGAPPAQAAILVQGLDLPPRRSLAVDHVVVVNSAGFGVSLFQWAGFAPGSNRLVVTGAGQTQAAYPYPLRISLNAVGTVPPGRFDHNGTDAIQVVGEPSHYKVEIDDAFHARGVPYQIGGAASSFGIIEVDGGASGVATLTFDAGVTTQFYSSGSNIGGLFVGSNGTPGPSARLIAVGTAAAPVVFTGVGTSPPPGYWEGITFRSGLASGNRLEHVVIDAAGAHGGDQGFGCPPNPGDGTDGALKLFTQPAGQFLLDSTISRSISHGIFRAWTGAQVDFMATNSFSAVAWCDQVLPKPVLPEVCPEFPECPQSP